MHFLEKSAFFSFFLFVSVCCIVFNCSFDKKQKLLCKTYSLSTCSNLYDRKAFYKLKIVFINPLGVYGVHKINLSSINTFRFKIHIAKLTMTQYHAQNAQMKIIHKAQKQIKIPQFLTLCHKCNHTMKLRRGVNYLNSK